MTLWRPSISHGGSNERWSRLCRFWKRKAHDPRCCIEIELAAAAEALCGAPTVSGQFPQSGARPYPVAILDLAACAGALPHAPLGGSAQRLNRARKPASRQVMAEIGCAITFRKRRDQFGPVEVGCVGTVRHGAFSAMGPGLCRTLDLAQIRLLRMGCLVGKLRRIKVLHEAGAINFRAQWSTPCLAHVCCHLLLSGSALTGAAGAQTLEACPFTLEK